MNLRELIAAGRTESRDVYDAFFCTDPEWIDFFNEAVDEVCIRTRSIENEGIELDSDAGDPYIKIPDYIWSIQRVTYSGRKLILLDKQMLDECEGDGWESQQGTPISCYEVGGKLRLYPTPDGDGTVLVHAFCTPENPMKSNSDEPEGVKPRLHRKLVDWALHCFYSKKDADVFDANLAAVHESKFNDVFGPRPDEKSMRRLRINVRRRVSGVFF